MIAGCISIVGVCADQPEKVGHSERAWHFGKILRRGPTLGVHGGVVKHGVEKRADLAEHLGGVVGEFAVVGVCECGFLLASGGDAFAAHHPLDGGVGAGLHVIVVETAIEHQGGAAGNGVVRMARG